MIEIIFSQYAMRLNVAHTQFMITYMTLFNMSKILREFMTLLF